MRQPETMPGEGDEMRHQSTSSSPESALEECKRLVMEYASAVKDEQFALMARGLGLRYAEETRAEAKVAALDSIDRLAALIRAEALEEAAKVCEMVDEENSAAPRWNPLTHAAAIRALK